MSTGPGPTRKADGSHDDSVDDVADFLVDDEGPKAHPENEVESGQILDDGLDVMLETPGPVLVNSFMPPPPAPAKGAAEEDSEGPEESSSATNLAYEDLLAKLVLPAKPSEPEPAMPTPAGSLPLLDPASVPYKRPSSPSFLVAPPTDERTLVTENPLLAEEQEAAAREGRSASREIPNVVREEMRPALTEPLANGVAKSRLVYLMLGGLLVLVGMILAVLVLKLIMPAPAPVPVVITPAPAPPPPAPPTHVEPLPPTEHVVPALAVPAPPAAPAGEAKANAAASEAPSQAPSEGEAVMPEAEKSQPKVHRSASRPKAPSHASSAKPAVAAKPAAPAKAQKPAATKKSGKASQGWVDPFDN
jgi:hypothetical protein